MYDVIVIGIGGVGSAALYALASRGVKVLGLDRFPPGHDRGSSHGQTRIIRRSYFEHPDYVPLLNSAYTLWDELCRVRSSPLLTRTGIVYVGPPDSVVIGGVRDSANRHQINVEELTTTELSARFPGFAAAEQSAVLYEPDAGYLLVEDCVKAFAEQATGLGASLSCGETVLSWSAHETGVVVETDSRRYEASRLVITAGCWSRQLLAELNMSLRILRKHLHWYAANDLRYEQTASCPCFFYEALDGFFYGFPSHAGSGLKVAEHSGGQEITDPLLDDRHPDPADTQRVETFLQRFLSGVSSQRLRHDVCFYTMTPDGHFIVDHHPAHRNVVFAAGLSGHGFKFAPALGEILASLTLDGRYAGDLEFLSLQRAGLNI